MKANRALGSEIGLKGIGRFYRLSTRDRDALNAVVTKGIHWLRMSSDYGINEATYQLARVYEQVI
jgi:hypothetical protein